MLSNKDYQRIFHEIKNVISVIGGSLQLVEKQHPEVKDYSFWENTMADITDLETILRDVSKYGIDEKPKKEFVNLHDFLSDLQVSAQALFAEDSSAIFQIPDNSREGYFDPLRIREALLNLIKNSYEATGENAKLMVRAYCKGTSLFFEVTDNGPGMSEEVLENIFVPFYTQKSEGSGLGMTIVKNIVEAHGGTITANSTLGHGSTFIIELPEQPIQTGKSDPMSEVS